MESLEPRLLLVASLPDLADDSLTVRENDPVQTVDVLANDHFGSDYDGAGLITSVSYGSGGGFAEIDADGKSLRYTPRAGFSGEEFFLYFVDGRQSARVTVEVQSPLRTDQFSVLEHSNETVLDVLKNDRFWNDYVGQRLITAVSAPRNGGTVRISDDGRSVRYQPAVGFQDGRELFRYQVDDEFETYASVFVRRVIQDDEFEIDVNSYEFELTLTDNDWYYKSGEQDIVDRITSVTATEQAARVEITEDGQSVRYTPPSGFEGIDRFVYVADDYYEASVTVLVSTPMRNDRVVTLQDSPAANFDVLANDFRGNGYSGPKQITSVSQSEHGATLEISADGRSVSYLPQREHTGSDSFTYTVDGELAATVWVDVRPRAGTDRFSFCVKPAIVDYDLDVLWNDSFADDYAGDGLITSVEQPSNAYVSIEDGGRKLRLTTGQPGTGYFPFYYTVDEFYTARASVSVNGRLNRDRVTVGQNDLMVVVDVLQNDDLDRCNRYNVSTYDGPGLITSVEQRAGGVVSIAEDGRTVLYSPPADMLGVDSFKYTVDGIQQAKVTVKVVRQLRDDRVHADPDSQDNIFSVLVNDGFITDYTGDRLITAVTATEAGGQISISDDGKNVLYSPSPGFTGTDTFTYTVDGKQKAKVEVAVNSTVGELLQRFTSVDDLEEFLIDDALDRYDYLFDNEFVVYDRYDHTSFRSSGSVPGNFQIPRSNSFSITNVQVGGVDEADIIENDGEFLYLLVQRDLVIVKAWPAEEMAEVARVPIEGYPFAEYLDGDRLTVLSKVRTTRQQTFVTVFDVSDRTEPRLVSQIALDGYNIDSRAIGGTIYFVQSSPFYQLPPPSRQEIPTPEPAYGGTTYVYETRDEYLEHIRSEIDSILDEMLPHYTVIGAGAGGETSRTPFHDVTNIFRWQIDFGDLVSVIALDTTGDTPGVTSSVGVVASNASRVYGSLDHLYVFDKGSLPGNRGATTILQFSWNNLDEEIAFVATGVVPGQMSSQFSADEFNGYLRLVTTVEESPRNRETTLFVLQENGGVLEFVGGVQGLSPGQSVRSVRFFGERAFVVTFDGTDPLLAFDLSDPADPRFVGQLLVPGFSSYMQLIDANHILAVGLNTPDGLHGPIQVSLFDVSDLSRPNLIDAENFPLFSVNSFSLAPSDHHAFGWFAEHQVLALPSRRSGSKRVDPDGDGIYESRSFREDDLLVFKINVSHTQPSEDAIKLQGTIEHTGNLIRRSAYIADVLYSFGFDSLIAVEISDPSHLIRRIPLRTTATSFVDKDIRQANRQSNVFIPAHQSAEVSRVRPFTLGQFREQPLSTIGEFRRVRPLAVYQDIGTRSLPNGILELDSRWRDWEISHPLQPSADDVEEGQGLNQSPDSTSNEPPNQTEADGMSDPEAREGQPDASQEKAADSSDAPNSATSKRSTAIDAKTAGNERAAVNNATQAVRVESGQTSFSFDSATHSGRGPFHDAAGEIGPIQSHQMSLIDSEIAELMVGQNALVALEPNSTPTESASEDIPKQHPTKWIGSLMVSLAISMVGFVSLVREPTDSRRRRRARPKRSE